MSGSASSSHSLSARIRARLSRISTSGRLIEEIDGLRWFAILAVIALHNAATYANRQGVSADDDFFLMLLHQGGVGVNLFFVISGFVLALPFAEHHRFGAKPIRLGKYYTRRLTRLEPPYIIAMTAFLFAHMLFNQGSLSELAPHYLSSITYTHFFAYGSPSSIMHVAWSLEVEVQFYLLAPFLTYVFAIRDTAHRRTAMLMLMLGSCLLLQFAPSSAARTLRLTIAGQLCFFVAGFMLVDIYLDSLRDNQDRSYTWDLVATVGWFSIPLISQNLGLRYLGLGTLLGWGAEWFLLAMVMLLTYYACFRGRIWNAIVRFPWIVTFGGMCYTLYLFHVLVISIVGNRVFGGFHPTSNFTVNLLLMLALMSTITFLLGAILFACFERPFMRRNWHVATFRWLRARFAREDN